MMSTALERENADLSWRLNQLTAEMTRARTPLSGEEHHEMREAQARFDSVAAALGDSAGPPVLGERPLEYRRRLAGKLATHSGRFKNSRFDSAEAAVLDVIEPLLHADAVQAARNSAGIGKTIQVVSREDGRDITRTYGDPLAWMRHFTCQGVSGFVNRYPNGTGK